ncbi:MAG: 23S rRNA (uracil(1939)-C(5))-methyltransferase RlmD [Clostridiales bacterium]|nr:23S rRNA (uracil(1939)-C(5))-methyltransferase RlmD [Clostridiales bacterium]
MISSKDEGSRAGVCAHNEVCGGCDYQAVSYEDQLRIKNDEVKRLLEEKSVKFGEYLGISGSPDMYRYRNKMEYTFGNMAKGGELSLGMHQKQKFMSIATVDECQLVDVDFNAVLAATLEFCREKGYSFYNKKSHKGFLRHLVMRRGVRTSELLVNVVTSSQGHFLASEYIGVLFNLKLNNSIVGILNTVNDGLSDTINCDKLNVLWGRDYYTERIMDLDFKVGAFSFFQTNVAAAERLYAEAVAMAGDLTDRVVFDLFCGTGTISQVLAKKAKKVTGIELAHEAVVSARENAAMNSIGNCEFVEGDVFEAMNRLGAQPDVIVLDPPRAGVQPKALDKIIQYGAGQIVYISCNPKSFVENLYYLQYYGYKPEIIKAYDNFPFTKHCECVASLRNL